MFKKISLIDSQIRVFNSWIGKKKGAYCNLQYLEDIEQVCKVSDILDLTDQHVVDFMDYIAYKYNTEHAQLSAQQSINSIRRFYMARGKNAKLPVGKPPHVEKIEQAKKFKEMGLSHRQIARALQVDVSHAFKMVKYDINRLNLFKRLIHR